MRGGRTDMDGWGAEFHSDSKCKLEVKDGERRSRRQAVERGGGTEERKVWSASAGTSWRWKPQPVLTQISDSVACFIGPISTSLDRKARLRTETTTARWGKLVGRAGPILAIYLELVVCRECSLKWSVWFSDSHPFVSALPIAFTTKKTSGGEKKQQVRRRSLEGQCRKHSRKLEL